MVAAPPTLLAKSPPTASVCPLASVNEAVLLNVKASVAVACSVRMYDPAPFISTVAKSEFPAATVWVPVPSNVINPPLAE